MGQAPDSGTRFPLVIRDVCTTIVENRPVYYSNVDAESQFSGGTQYQDVDNRGNAVVSTALMIAENLEWTREDAWGHPKIPRIDELELAESNNSTERPWYTVDPTGNYSYASLAGINVITLSEQGATNFTIPYEYMYFNCELSPGNNMSKPTAVEPPLPWMPTILNYLRDLQSQGKLTTEGRDFTDNVASSAMSASLLDGRSFFIYTKGTWDNMEGLLYGSKYIALTMFLWECSMNSVMVETNIV